MLQAYSSLPLLIAGSIFLNETDLNEQKQYHTVVKVHNLHFYFDKYPSIRFTEYNLRISTWFLPTCYVKVLRSSSIYYVEKETTMLYEEEDDQSPSGRMQYTRKT